MVHTFTVDQRYFALDEASGSVHLLDRLSYRILQNMPSLPDEAIVQLLSVEFENGEIREALQEIHELMDGGMLFTPEMEHDIHLDGPKVIKAMCLHVTHDCNLRCAYCFAGEGAFKGDRCLMPLETGKKALEFLIEKSGKRRNLEVDFFGGEPLMNWQVVKELVAYGRELEIKAGKNIRFTITTNGMALDAEKIAFINREMSNVVISLDGRREVHDRMRPTRDGKGSYDRIAEKAKALVASRGGKDYYIRGTFTRYNLDFDRDIQALAEEGFQNLSIEPVVCDPSLPYSLLPEHLTAITEAYDRLVKLCMDPPEDAKPFRFFHFKLDLGKGACIAKRLTGCGAGNEYVAITPQGDIYPCHQFVGETNFCMGNVLDGSFNTDIQNHFRNNHVLSKPSCNACWARYFCSGGCAANAWHSHGRIDQPYELECAMEKKRLECAMALYSKEREDA